jgi:hypothetical protein
MEELKGLSREAFARLTDMRSSGVAEIPKIERGKARARTRIIANSNPRSKRPLSAYNYGIDTVVELIPSLEDIRRFDLVIILNREDVDVAKLANQPHDDANPKYDKELARRLVLWAWTRSRQQVLFTTECEEYLRDATISLCGLFVDDVPIIDRGSTRHKLARLATAIAARTFSCTENYDGLVVDERHARYAHQFISDHYSSKANGYFDYSNWVRSRGKMLSGEEIILQLAASPHSRDLVGHLLNTNSIEQQDFCDWCGWDRLEALPLVSCSFLQNFIVRSESTLKRSSSHCQNLRRVTH